MVDEMKINKKIIDKTRKYAKKIHNKIELVHDWDHISFVVKHAKYIAKKEKMNVRVVEMGALLHDISQEDMTIKDLLTKDHAIPAAQKAEKFLQSLNLDKETINHILDTIKYHSSSEIGKAKTREALAVYDGDKLDVVGPRGFIRALCSYTKYECPKANIDELYKFTIAAGKGKLTTLRTKTGRKLARKYFNQMKDFIKGYEKLKKSEINGR